jgi:hypothetical protein
MVINTELTGNNVTACFNAIYISEHYPSDVEKM